MKSMRIPMFAVMLLTMLIGCSDDGPVVAPPLAADKASAVVETGTAVFEHDGTEYFDCMGEVVHSVVYAPYKYRIITLPDGETVYVEKWLTKEVTGTVTGLESGLVWERVLNVAPWVEVKDQVLTATFRGTFVSTNGGPTYEAREQFHVIRNASGELVSDFYSMHCWEAPN